MRDAFVSNLVDKEQNSAHYQKAHNATTGRFIS